MKVILLLSGGIDSTTLLHELVERGLEVHCLIFDYGQTLQKEVQVAVNNATRLRQPYKVISIDLGFSGSKCSLISDTEIDKGRMDKQINKKTPSSYVEFRNGILLSYAVMYAEVNDIHRIYGGFNGLNSGNYYDDTRLFIQSFSRAANIGTDPDFWLKILSPYAKINKSDIVERGKSLKNPVNYSLTWSCYENGEEHCGQCDSCYQRKKAFKGWINEKI